MLKKILIIDDEVDFVDLLGLRLAGHYKILKAYNGAEALETAKNEKPDLILSDLMMPKMDGFQLLENLKKHVDTEHIPFVILSADEDSRTIFKAQEMGVADYLIKPTHLDTLPDVLARFF
jgi:PleD family two-component response regulator